MAQYKLRQKAGAKQPEVSKWGSGFNVVAVLICIIVSVLIWLCAIGIEYRENQQASDAETGNATVEAYIPDTVHTV